VHHLEDKNPDELYRASLRCICTVNTEGGQGAQKQKDRLDRVGANFKRLRRLGRVRHKTLRWVNSIDLSYYVRAGRLGREAAR
jgi:hypothetical protein